MKRFLALFLVAASLSGAELSKNSMLREYKSQDPRFAKADAVLNRVRFATVDVKRAKQYVRELEDVLEQYPDYKFRAEVYYFLGVNRKLSRDFGGAVDAFSHALNLKPELARRAPIAAYIRTSEFEHRAVVIPRVAWTVLAAVLVLGIFLAVRDKAWLCVSRRAVLIAAGCLVLWLAAFFVSTAIDTRKQVNQIESYPKPVLVNTTLGTIGDAPFKGILGFGTAAVAVSILFGFATSRITPTTKRYAVSIAGSIVASTALMTLCYMQFCYRTAKHAPGALGGRMNILIKDIVWREDIPDEMLELYDPNFRKEILKGRQKK